MFHVALHFRRLAEQHREVHVDGFGLAFALPGELAVFQRQMLFLRGHADHGIGAALALAQGAEGFEFLFVHRQHVALLRLVAPDFHGRHAGLVVRHRAQVEVAAAAGAVHQFRQRVRQAAGADVVDRKDGIVLAQRPALVDDLLAAPLHLGVGALHRGEIELFVAGAGGHARGRAAAEADEHGRTADDDDLRARRNLALVHMLRADVAEAAGEHDRLVVAAHLAVHFQLEAAEITADVGAAEFVIEGRRRRSGLRA